MLQKLFLYYWNILKNGRQEVCSPLPNAPYGREELKLNQHWYGFTALALVIGLAIGVSGLWYLSIQEKKISYYPIILIPDCSLTPPPPPPEGNSHWIIELKQGTKASFIQYKIPRPSPKKEIEDTGIRKKLDSKDSQSDLRPTCANCVFVLPEIPEPEEEVIYPNEPGCSCGFFVIDEKPRPVNLKEITKLITYPSLLQGKGGTVVLRVLIDKNGRYKRHSVLKADNSQLLLSVEEHIGKLKFTPSIEWGRPKKFWVHVPFVFKALGERVEISAPSKTPVDQAEHLMPTSEQLLELFSEEMLIEDDPFIHEPIEEKEPRIDEFIFLDQEPIPLNMHEVKKLFSYPKLALEAEISGRVILRVLVNKKGRISKHKVMNEVHPLLAQEFEKHIYALKFKPAIHENKRVDAWVNIPFHILPLD